MTRLTLATVLAIAILVLSGSRSRMDAAPGDTKIVIQDGGSLIIHPDGLDDGSQWTLSKPEIRSKNDTGIVTGVQIAEAGISKCGDDLCGIDPSQPWNILVVYGKGSLTIKPTAATNTGLHVTHRNMPFDRWNKTKTDERETGHGDGLKIKSVSINGGPNLCAGYGCVITVMFPST